MLPRAGHSQLNLVYVEEHFIRARAMSFLSVNTLPKQAEYQKNYLQYIKASNCNHYYMILNYTFYTGTGKWKFNRAHRLIVSIKSMV